MWCVEHQIGKYEDFIALDTPLKWSQALLTVVQSERFTNAEVCQHLNKLPHPHLTFTQHTPPLPRLPVLTQHKSYKAVQELPFTLLNIAIHIW